MPTSPPSVTTLPTPPSREDPANFTARADAFLTAQPTFQSDTNAVAANVYANAVEAAASATQAQSDRVFCEAAAAAVAAQSPAANAVSAAMSAAAAAVSAAQAQAVSPDSPVRLNTRAITQPMTIGSAYNAMSAGPIRIDDEITVTVQDNATWSIQ